MQISGIIRTPLAVITASCLLILTIDLAPASCQNYGGGGGASGGYGGSSGYAGGASGGYGANSRDSADGYGYGPIIAGGISPAIGYPVGAALLGFSWPFIFGGYGGLSGFNGAESLGKK